MGAVDQNQRYVKGSNPLLVAGLVILAGVLFTVLQVQQSTFQGQLSLPITYDDITYFVDALRRLHRFYDQGLPRLILDWFEKPPHSPTSTFTPLLGFAIFGQRDWSPAAANSLYLIGFLSFIAYITSHLSWFYRVTIALIGLTCPLSGHLLIESRPDILCGLATACAFLLLKNSGSAERRKPQILAGTMAGLAFLAKPSISPITAIILLAGLCTVAVRDWLRLRQQTDASPEKSQGLSHVPTILHLTIFHISTVLRILRQYTTFVIVTLLISLPHYLLAIRQIFAYIYSTLFGADKEMWQTDYPFAEQVLYYISGSGGKMMFGAWGSVVLLVALLALAVATLTQAWQSLWNTVPYLGIIGVAYLLVTIPSTKSPFLGMAFGGIILLTTIDLLIDLAQELERRSSRRYRVLGQAACVAIIVASLSLFQWPWFNKVGLPRAGTTAQATYEQALLNSISRRLEETIGKSSPHCAPQIALTAESAYLNSWTVEYELLKRGFDNFTTLPMLVSGKFNAYWRGIRHSNYVIAFSTDNPTSTLSLPAEAIQTRLLKKLSTTRRFQLIKTFDRPKSLGAGKVFLYQAKQRCKPLPENPLIK